MRLRRMLLASAAIVPLVVLAAPPLTAAPFGGPNDNATTTPITHVIIIIGENRTFDHIFATCQPHRGETIVNLLTAAIVRSDGTPGANFNAARQHQASMTKSYAISPTLVHPYATLPPPNTGGTPELASDEHPPPSRHSPRPLGPITGFLPAPFISC